jgi:hypothetical protein
VPDTGWPTTSWSTWAALRHTVGAADLAPMQRMCPPLLTGQTVGTGHIPHRDAPQQVKAMPERVMLVGGVQTAVETPHRRCGRPAADRHSRRRLRPTRPAARGHEAGQ